LNFPFISAPDASTIEASVALLKDLKCLTPAGDITQRGRTFFDLPFDPRLSNFVITAHEVYNAGTIATAIATVSSAPGSIFFTGGSTKEAKQKAREKVSVKAAEHYSDILFFFFI